MSSSSDPVISGTTDIRKRKRMVSNRESARRSRMRKQKLLDDLTAEMNNLRAENHHLLTNINVVTHLYLKVESENSVLRAQMSELDHRLHSLNQIITPPPPPPPPALFQHQPHGDFDIITDDFFIMAMASHHDVLLY